MAVLMLFRSGPKMQKAGFLQKPSNLRDVHYRPPEPQQETTASNTKCTRKTDGTGTHIWFSHSVSDEGRKEKKKKKGEKQK